jgi:hypothetical protein
MKAIVVPIYSVVLPCPKGATIEHHTDMSGVLTRRGNQLFFEDKLISLYCSPKLEHAREFTGYDYLSEIKGMQALGAGTVRPLLENSGLIPTRWHQKHKHHHKEEGRGLNILFPETKFRMEGKLWVMGIHNQNNLWREHYYALCTPVSQNYRIAVFKN